MGLRAPRNEKEFSDELKGWFISQSPWGRADVHRMVGMVGKPDLMFTLRDSKGKSIEFWVEAKWVKERPRTMRQVWGLLRGSQQNVIPRMVAAGSTVYLVMCVGGKEAWWYHFHPNQCTKMVNGKAAGWTCIYIRYVMERDFLGRWRKEASDPAEADGRPHRN